MNNTGSSAQIHSHGDLFSVSAVNVFALPYDFRNNMFSSLAYCSVRIQCIIHITENVCPSTVYTTVQSQLQAIRGKLLFYFGVKS